MQQPPYPSIPDEGVLAGVAIPKALNRLQSHDSEGRGGERKFTPVCLIFLCVVAVASIVACVFEESLEDRLFERRYGDRCGICSSSDGHMFGSAWKDE